MTPPPARRVPRARGGDRAIRVFVVDDSAACRAALSRAIDAHPCLEVAGTAASGEAALRRVPTVRPDVVVMDIVMDGLDGIETTARLMQTYPVPILIVSEGAGRDARQSFQALAAGALDVVNKPTPDPEALAALTAKLLLIAQIPVVGRRSRQRAPGSTVTAAERSAAPAPPQARRPKPADGPVELVVAGASTGGPAALAAVLGALEGRAPWPVLVAQHITPGFTVGLARWLEASTGTAVRVVTAEAPLEPGRVYLASDGCHLELSGRWLRSVTDPGALNRPSVDRLFCSVAASPLASRTLAILLTGMGSDGALGTLRLAQAGARTIAQDAATSVVFGMPRAAVEAGGVSEVRSLTEIGRALAALAAGTVSRQR